MTSSGTLDEEQWCTPSPAAGWDVRDEIAHLAFFDDVALASHHRTGRSSFRRTRSGDALRRYRLRSQPWRRPVRSRGARVVARGSRCRSGGVPSDRPHRACPVGTQSNGGGELVHGSADGNLGARPRLLHGARRASRLTASGSAMCVTSRTGRYPTPCCKPGRHAGTARRSRGGGLFADGRTLALRPKGRTKPHRGHRLRIRQGGCASHEPRRGHHLAGDRTARRNSPSAFEGIPVTDWN